MIDSKTLDLIIRANVEKGGDLKKITQSIAELGKTIEQQASAAKKGEGSIDTLRDAYAQLEQVADRLKSQADLVGQFQRTSVAIEGTTKRVEASKKRYEEFLATIANVDARTEKQEERLRRLTAAYDKSQATLQRHKTTYAELGAQLAATGVDTKNLAATEETMVAAAKELNLTFAKGQSALKTFGGDMKVAADRARELELSERKAASATAEFAEMQRKAAAAAAATKTANAAGDSANNIRQAAEAAKKGAEYVQWWRTELAKADDELKAIAAQKGALDQIAKDAEKTAAGFTTLARASSNLTPKFTALRDVIKGIVDPAAQARTSLHGIETEVDGLAKSIGSINGPVAEYQAKLSALAAAQKSIAGQAELVDSFRRQVQALKEAREAFTQARAQVTQYAQAVRAGGSDTDANNAALKRSQAELGRAAAAMRAQVVATREAREGLRAAGLAANDLATAENRLVASARQATGATQSLTAAVAKYGMESEKAAGHSFMKGAGGGGLSVWSRIKQDVIGATASVVGLYGAFNLAKSSIEALINLETTRNKIAVATDSNDPKVIAEGMAYARKQAEHFGVEINTLAGAYGTFAIASKAAKYTTDQTRYAFEQLTGGMRVNGMNAEQMGRAFTQVQQILSKTKPEIEDIKTIAESGFAGVQNLMAKGLLEIGVAGIKAGSEVQDMAAMMKAGTLDSQTAIYALAVGIETNLGDKVPAAITSLMSELGRFQTAVTDFVTLIATSGFADEFKKALIEIKEYMQGTDGAALAKNFSDGFSLIAQAVVWVFKNLNPLIEATKILVALWALNWMSGKIEQLGLFAAELGKTQLATVSLTTAVGLLSAAMRGLQAFLIGWEIGKWATDNFEIVRLAGVEMGTGIAEVLTRLKAGFDFVIADFPGGFKNAFIQVANFARQYMGEVIEWVGKVALKVGATGAYLKANSIAAGLKADWEETGDKEAGKKVLDQYEKDLAELKRIRQEMRDAVNKPLLDPAFAGPVDSRAFNDRRTSEASPTLRPDTPTGNAGGGKDKKADAKTAAAEAKIESLDTLLDKLEAKIDKASTNTLAVQLGSVEKEYEGLKDRIGKEGGKAGEEYMKRLAIARDKLRQQISDKFEKGFTDEKAGLQSKLNSMDAKAERTDKDNLAMRLQSITSEYATFYTELEELKKKFQVEKRDTSELDGMKARMDENKALLATQTEAKYNVEQIKKAEKNVNDILDERKDRIEIINQQLDVHLISEEKARTDINAVVDATSDKLTIAIEKARQVVLALQGGVGVTPAIVDKTIAGLDLAAASGTKYKESLTASQEALSQLVTGEMMTGLESAATNLAAAATGQQSWTDAIKETGKAFATMVAGILKGIAEMIIKEMILKAVRSYMGAGAGGGDVTSGWSAAMNTPVGHTGGIVGSLGRSRSAPAALFANAPRYHAGGITGLAADEYPAILQRNEEILSKDSPRNIVNAAGKPAAPQGGNRFVLVDDRSKVPEAMSSAEGEKVTLMHLKRNVASVKQLLK